MRRSISMFALALFIIILYACRKDSLDIFTRTEIDEGIYQPSEKMNYQLAVKYYSQVLKKEQGDKVVSKSNRTFAGQENLKRLMFSKIYESETKTASFVEIPLFYNRRSSMLIYPKGTEHNDKNVVLRASFDRLVIYKDKKTGEVDQKIIRYIPSLKYLKKHGYKISHNQINKIDRDFEGYIEYLEWDSTPLYFFRMANGKKVAKVKFKLGTRKNKGKQAQTSEVYCNVYCWDEWEEDCSKDNPETSELECTWSIIDSGCDILDCWEEPDPSDPDPEPDPEPEPEPEPCTSNCEDCSEEQSNYANLVAGNTSDAHISIVDVDPSSSTMSSKHAGEALNTTRKRLYSWEIFRNHYNSYRVRSTELGTHVQQGGAWKWQDIEHKNAILEGTIVGVSLEYIPVAQLGQVVENNDYGQMEVRFAMKYSAVCNGSPLHWTSSQYTSKRKWHVSATN